MSYPKIRMRDRRKDEATRKRFRETAQVSASDLIMPVFVKEGIVKRKEIKSMPGIYQFPLREVAVEARKIYDLGIPAVILFGIPKYKDEIGSSAYDDNGITQEAIRIIKKKVPMLTVIADVCMCEYVSHGHCGVIKKKPETSNQKPEFDVDNDETIKILAKIAVSYAKAGVDVVAPSAMMDGQVKAIKGALVKNNFPKIKIMSYSSKYASSFYGPFRDAAESPPQFGDRKTYQMDYYNSDEAVLEAKLDIGEGADMVMVKPALGYQDIIYRLKKELKFPLACYSVSGEYSMIKAAACAGWLDEKKVVLEMLTGFKRAGADKIITYYAKAAAKWFKT
ncbi:MAG: porphobilinogen synthase [Candidatus Omnitrophota bacterium]|nr:porphobilinogen synthase [Candidatus Omnitrophota bacterium]